MGASAPRQVVSKVTRNLWVRLRNLNRSTSESLLETVVSSLSRIVCPTKAKLRAHSLFNWTQIIATSRSIMGYKIKPSSMTSLATKWWLPWTCILFLEQRGTKPQVWRDSTSKFTNFTNSKILILRTTMMRQRRRIGLSLTSCLSQGRYAGYIIALRISD